MQVLIRKGGGEGRGGGSVVQKGDVVHGVEDHHSETERNYRRNFTT